MAKTMVIRNKSNLLTLLMNLVTLPFNMVLVACEWSHYECGSISLWQECTTQNYTQCIHLDAESDTRKNMNMNVCRQTTGEGPAWFQLCGTMVCFALVSFFLMHYTLCKWGEFSSPPKTFTGQMKLRLPFIIYFFNGCLMVGASALFYANFYDHYTESGKREGVKPSWVNYFGLACGAVTMANAVFLSIKFDTGFKIYLKKSKLNFCKPKTDAQSSGRGNETQNLEVEIKSRFAIFACCVKHCVQVVGRSENNDSERRQVRNRGGLGETQTQTQAQSAPPGVEVGGGIPVAVVRGQGHQRETSPADGESPNPSGKMMSIYVIDNNNENGDNSAGFDVPTEPRCTSASQLNVEVLSPPGVDDGSDGNLPASVSTVSTSNTTGRPRMAREHEAWMTALPVLNVDAQRMYFYNNQNGTGVIEPPPSYDEVMRNDSGC